MIRSQTCIKITNKQHKSSSQNWQWFDGKAYVTSPIYWFVLSQGILNANYCQLTSLALKCFTFTLNLCSLPASALALALTLLNWSRTHLIFTVRNSSWWKVMSLQVSICSQGDRVSLVPCPFQEEGIGGRNLGGIQGVRVSRGWGYPGGEGIQGVRVSRGWGYPGGRVWG